MQNIKYNYYFTSIFEKKKNFQNQKSKLLHFVLFRNPLSTFHIRRKKEKKSIVLPFIVTRTITDRQETEVDSREKKTPLNPSNIPCFEGGWRVNAQTTSNGRAFLFEFPTPLLRIICHFTGGNSSLPSPPPLPCSRRPTRGSTKPLRIDPPPLSSSV